MVELRPVGVLRSAGSSARPSWESWAWARPAGKTAEPRCPITWGVVAGNRATSGTRAVAEKNVLTLDTSMMDIYEDSLAKYKRNIASGCRSSWPSSAGRGPDDPLPPRPRTAGRAPVPIVYQLAKSVCHSSMAIYQLVAPYLADPSDQSWQAPMQAYRSQCQRPSTACAASTCPRTTASPPRHPQAQPRVHGRMPREGDVHLRASSRPSPATARPTSARPSGSRRTPRSGTGWRSSRAGRRCWARTGTAPTPSATRST